MGRPLNPELPDETPAQRHLREKELLASSDGGGRAPSDGPEVFNSQVEAVDVANGRAPKPKFQAVPPPRKKKSGGKKKR